MQKCQARGRRVSSAAADESIRTATQLEAKQNAAQTAFEANRIKSNTDAATGSANALASAFGRAANEAERAASAAAGAGGGGGGGGGGGDASSQWTNAYRRIVTRKVDQNGNIVDKTPEEIKREKGHLRVGG